MSVNKDNQTRGSKRFPYAMAGTLDSLQAVFDGVRRVLLTYQDEFLSRRLPPNLAFLSLECEAHVGNAAFASLAREALAPEATSGWQPDTDAIQKQLVRFKRITDRAVNAKQKAAIEVWKYAQEPLWYAKDVIQAIDWKAFSRAEVQAYRRVVASFGYDLLGLIPRWLINLRDEKFRHVPILEMIAASTTKFEFP